MQTWERRCPRQGFNAFFVCPLSLRVRVREGEGWMPDADVDVGAPIQIGYSGLPKLPSVK